MGCNGEVVVFTDTNIGTYIALAAAPDITTADFRRELERTHFRLFPDLGEIKVHGLMVWRKNCFYHLTESLPIKYAFQGLKGTWFLHVEVQLSSNLDKPGTRKNKHKFSKQKTKPLAEELWKTSSHLIKNGRSKTSICILDNRMDDIEECLNIDEVISDAAGNESVVFQMSGNKIKPVMGPSIAMVENPKERFQEQTLFVKRNSSELNSQSKCSNPQSSEVTSIVIECVVENQLKGKRDNKNSVMKPCSFPHFATGTPPRTLPSVRPIDPSPESSQNKLETTAAVGRRILVAANNLKVSGNKQRPLVAFYRFRNSSSMPSISKMSMFEISDSDD